MEVWWRAAALEALKAFILSPLLAALQSESGKLQRRLALILQPMLEAMLASPILQVSLAFHAHHALGVQRIQHDLLMPYFFFEIDIISRCIKLVGPSVIGMEGCLLCRIRIGPRAPSPALLRSSSCDC